MPHSTTVPIDTESTALISLIGLLDNAAAIASRAVAAGDPVRLRHSLALLRAELNQPIWRAKPPRQFTAAHARALFLLADTRGATDTQLFRRWQAKAARPADVAWPFISAAGLRSRRAELADWGLVEWSGGYGRTLSNRPSKVWVSTTEVLASRTPIPAALLPVRRVLDTLIAEAGTDVVLLSALRQIQHHVQAI